MGIELMVISMFSILSVLLTIVAWNINDLNSEGVIYGIRVPRSYREHEEILKIIQNFRKNIIILNTLTFILFLVVFNFWSRVFILMIFIFLLTIIQIGCYMLSNKKMLSLKYELKWNEMSSSNKVFVEIGKKKEVEKPYYIYIFGIALGIAIIGIVILLFKFSSLPDLVPVHFSNGAPDRYADITTLAGKLEVFMIPLLNLLLVVGMFIYTKKYNQKMNTGRLNGGLISEIRGRRQVSKNVMQSLNAFTSLIVSSLMLFGELNMFGIVEYNNSLEKGLGIIALIIVAFPILFMVFANKLKIKKIKANKEDEEIYVDDDKYYIGGIFYYNKKDRNVMIVRRMGMGYDLNYATTIGKVIGAGNLLLIIGVTLLTLFMEV
ncbi:MAG: DUF1648 domain-containing protein [Clostridium sp.]